MQKLNWTDSCNIVFRLSRLLDFCSLLLLVRSGQLTGQTCHVTSRPSLCWPDSSWFCGYRRFWLVLVECLLDSQADLGLVWTCWRLSGRRAAPQRCASSRRTSTVDRYRTSRGLSWLLEAPCSDVWGPGAGWWCGTRRTERLLRL